GQRYLIRRPAEDFHPKLITAVRKEQPTDAATHTVTDHHHRFKMRKLLFHFIEFVAQDRCRIWEGISAWITVEPELIMLSDNRIALQSVYHRRPGGLRIL